LIFNLKNIFAMKNYLLLLFLCLGISTIAQQRQTWVVGQDGEFLIGANVVALKDGQFVKGTATSQEGSFTFDESQWDQLKISYIGYEELLLDKEEVIVDDLIILPLAKYNLAQVEVIANKDMIGTNCVFRCGVGKYKTTFVNVDGIESTQKDATDWKIFPNPTTDFVQINMEKATTGQVEIFDMNGKLVSKTLALDFPLTIDVSHLPSGSYFIRLETKLGITNLGQLMKVSD
jgi:hypothetical protein